jgi:hypothetical protein
MKDFDFPIIHLDGQGNDQFLLGPPQQFMGGRVQPQFLRCFIELFLGNRKRIQFSHVLPPIEVSVICVSVSFNFFWR